MSDRNWCAARCAAATVAAFGLAASASAAEHEWKCQSFWQPGTVNQRAFERFAANVEEKAGARIAIESLPVDAVVAPEDMLDAVAANILQCMNGGTAYFVGKDFAFALLADFNAGYETPEQLTDWFYEGGGLEIARELYEPYGVYYVGPVLWGAESIPSTKLLKNIKDFAGIKMRAPRGMGFAIWEKLGVSVETLPGSDVYPALESRTIDATDWGTLGMNDELGYGGIADYAIYPGIHSMPASDLAVNLELWTALPGDLKQILEDATVAFNRDSIEFKSKAGREFRRQARSRDPDRVGARPAARTTRGRPGDLGGVGRKERHVQEDLRQPYCIHA